QLLDQQGDRGAADPAALELLADHEAHEVRRARRKLDRRDPGDLVARVDDAQERVRLEHALGDRVGRGSDEVLLPGSQAQVADRADVRPRDRRQRDVRAAGYDRSSSGQWPWRAKYSRAASSLSRSWRPSKMNHSTAMHISRLRTTATAA